MRAIYFIGWLVCATGIAQAASNLVVNGSFDRKDDALACWKYKYDLEGESWYFDNHNFVSVAEKEETRHQVLKLHGTYATLQVPGQGVKVDSKPVPIDSKGRYSFSVYAKSTGPDCRIMLEGYQWRPGIKPHADPELHELRRCYKFSQLYFGGREAGTMGGVGRAWQKSSMTFPDAKMTELAREHYRNVKFIVIHIVAIGGSDGDLFVDDVTITKLQ